MLTTLIALAIGAIAPDEKAFAAGLDAVRALEDRSKWYEAKRKLLKLVADEGAQPWVVNRRTEIVEELTRCAVRVAVPQPDPQKMTDGKLLSWNRRTGEMAIAYERPSATDFQTTGEFQLHAAEFDGALTIKLDGDDFRWGGRHVLTVALGVHGEESVQVAIGARMQVAQGEYAALCSIDRVEGKKRETLASAERAPLLNKRFELQIAVSGEEIAVSCNGSRMVATKRPSELRGRVAIAAGGPLPRLTLRGKATPAWLQGRLDAATRDDEEAFFSKWRADDELPEWLRATAPEPAAPSAAIMLPWPLTTAQADFVHRTQDAIREGHVKDALTELERLSADALPRDVRDYLTCYAHRELGSLGTVEARLEGLCARNPEFVLGRVFHVDLLLERDRLDDAARELEALIPAGLDRGRLATRLAEVHLRRSRPDEAQRVLREARAAGVATPEFEASELQILNFTRGPNFVRRFEQKSDHFVVVTDMDIDTPKRALRVLEESYAICSQLFGAPDGAARTFPVYLFQGRASYEAYVGKLSPEMAHNTAGTYSPLFKQLLVWNQIEAPETLTTLRHETTHQYLDLLGYHPPVWLGEGLATYVQTIRSAKKADVNAGALEPRMVAILKRSRGNLVSLADLLPMSHQTFYANADVCYATAWALVHFLRHGGPASEEVNRRIMAALAERAGSDEIVRRAFDGIDLAPFESAFHQYVDRLGSPTEKR